MHLDSIPDALNHLYSRLACYTVVTNSINVQVKHAERSFPVAREVAIQIRLAISYKQYKGIPINV